MRYYLVTALLTLLFLSACGDSEYSPPDEYLVYGGDNVDFSEGINCIWPETFYDVLNNRYLRPRFGMRYSYKCEWEEESGDSISLGCTYSGFSGYLGELEQEFAIEADLNEESGWFIGVISMVTKTTEFEEERTCGTSYTGWIQPAR